VRPNLLLPLIVACALFIENMDATVLATALPMIARDLAVEPIALKLALTSYLISLAVFIPVSGWVADRFGARTTFATAIVVFMIGSLLCAISRSLEAFVGARFLQGLGGAMMVPVGRLVILRSIPRNGIVRALNTLTIPALLGPVIGPPLGGLITTYVHWSWIFFINRPIGLLGVALAIAKIPNLKETDVPPLDRLGFLLSAVGLAGTMLGLTTLWEHMLSVGWSIVCTGVGAASLALYVRHARRVPHPLLDLGIFRLATFRAGVIGGAVFRVGMGAIPFLLPLMLQVGFGLNPLGSGLLTFASAVGSLFMKTMSTRILRRWGFRVVLTVNSVLASLTIASFAAFTAGTSHVVIWAVLLVGGCLRSLQFTSLNAISYADVTQREMSQATSTASVAQQLAASFGVTIGAYILQASSWIRDQGVLAAPDFRVAFLIVGLLACASTLYFRRLAPEAGAELAGRVVANEPKLKEGQAAQPQTLV
jgi:EmrB/QacA subfamily drug resistance transporter